MAIQWLIQKGSSSFWRYGYGHNDCDKCSGAAVQDKVLRLVKCEIYAALRSSSWLSQLARCSIFGGITAMAMLRVCLVCSSLSVFQAKLTRLLGRTGSCRPKKLLLIRLVKT